MEPLPKICALMPALRAGLEFIQALDNAVLDALGHRLHGVTFVVQREIVKDVLLLDEHPAQAVGDDDRELKAERRIIRQARGNGAGVQQAVAVLMLQTFAVERGAAGGGAQQKAPRADVARQPEQVAHALRTEHRVIGVKRNHRHAVRGVAGGRREKRRHGAGLTDAFFENLAVLGFAIIEQRFVVHRLVKLALGGINADSP